MKKKVVVRISGGLGNQLFRYAAAWSLAQRTGRDLCFDLTDFFVFVGGRKYQMTHFSGPASTPHWEWRLSGLYLLAYIVYKRIAPHLFPKLLGWLRVTRLEEKSPWVLMPSFFSDELAAKAETLYVDGNCQHLGYLTDEGRIREQLRFSEPPCERNRSLFERLSAQPSVSVHVRRSDYLQLTGSPVLGLAYYEQAMKVICACEPMPLWVVFSDDIPWCREHLSFLDGAVFVDGNDAEPWEDLRLMATCKHHIIANSSFSWWGAYLCRDPSGMTVAPEKWFKGVTTSACLLKKGWIALPSF